MNEKAFTLPVYVTKDYKIFKKLNGNRELYSNHVKRLVKVIESDPEFTKGNPIRVNDKLQVIDGQHRLAAFEKYQEITGETPEIYYLISEGMNLKDAMKLNAGSKGWTAFDYASAHAKKGNENYITYLKVLEDIEKFDGWSVNHNVLVTFLGGELITSSEFRDGKFMVKNEAWAREGLEKLEDLGQYCPEYKLQYFGRAFFVVLNRKSYNHSRMLNQLKSYSDGLKGISPKQSEVVGAMNIVYNFGRKDKVSLLD